MAQRAALILFILFQVRFVDGQSIPDSGRFSHLDSPRQSIQDSSQKKPIIHTPVLPGIESTRSAHLNTDSIRLYITDSLRYSSKKPEDFHNMPVFKKDLLEKHAFFNFSGKPVHIRAERFEALSYDGLFYLLLGMLFYFAIIKLFFAKYLANLLTIFFKASMKQQQLREQILQAPFPSLLLNLLFVISGGLYGAFLLRFYHFGNNDQFWLFFLYCGGILTLLYLLKFMILKVTGWIFNISRAVETYLFVIFMTNKIIGICLLPFLVLISFSGNLVTEIGITSSIIMICVFYIYRFMASYATLHKEIKISGLHFFLYLCAFEIAPLLLIYKVLVTYLEKAY